MIYQSYSLVVVHNITHMAICDKISDFATFMSHNFVCDYAISYIKNCIHTIITIIQLHNYSGILGALYSYVPALPSF